MFRKIKIFTIVIIFNLIFLQGTLASSGEEEISHPISNKYKFEIEMTDSNPNLIGIISAVSALLAIIIGPIVTILIAKKQLSYPIQQKHVDRFDDISCMYLNAVDTYRKNIHLNLLSSDQKQASLSKLNLFYYQIRQMLDTSIPIHKNFIDKIFEFNFFIESNKLNTSDFEKYKDDIWLISREISAYKSRFK